jgi:hypothetical protein
MRYNRWFGKGNVIGLLRVLGCQRRMPCKKGKKVVHYATDLFAVESKKRVRRI